MTSLSYSYSFSNGNSADANQVNANFGNIVDFTNVEVVRTDGSVQADTGSIKDNAITNAKLANDAVDTAEIKDGAVTSAKIANATIVVGDLADDAVETAKIKNDAVTTAKIVNSAVTADKIADGAVTTGKLTNGGTYPISVSGNAATASSATSASTAASLSDSGATLSWNAGNGRWETPQSANISGYLNLFGGLNVYASQIYYGTIPSSSSTNYIVQRSDGILCYRSGTSLLKYKEDVKPIVDALSVVESLQPKSFVFKANCTEMDDPFEVFARRTQRQYGFVVDDILTVDSDLVDHDLVDGEFVPRMWKSEAVLSYAIAAIKELSAKVDALEAEVVALKNV